MIATRNRHKVEEIRAVLGGAVECVSLEAMPGAPEVHEDATTFAGNAQKKATTLAAWLRTQAGGGAVDFVLADDSGLEVDALGGAPGVHSARFAARDTGHAGNAPDGENNAKLLRMLAHVPAERRTARFRCVLALVPVQPAPGDVAKQVAFFEGRCEGRIDFAPRGQGGFGYDPLFIPTGFTQSFAELGETIKNQISHRAQALAQLRRQWPPQ